MLGAGARRSYYVSDRPSFENKEHVVANAILCRRLRMKTKDVDDEGDGNSW